MRTFRNLASMTAIGALSASMFAFAATPAGAVAPPTDSERFDQSYYAGDNSGDTRQGRGNGRPAWSDEWRGNVTFPEAWRQRDAWNPPQEQYQRPDVDARAGELWQRGRGNVTFPEAYDSSRGQYADARRGMSERDRRAYQDEMRWRQQADQQRMRGQQSRDYGYDRRGSRQDDYRGAYDQRQGGSSYSQSEHEQRLQNLHAWQDDRAGQRWQSQPRDRDMRDWRDEQRQREMQTWQAEQRRQDDMRRRHEEAFRRGYEAGRAYEDGGWQSSYDPWRMREYTEQWNDRAPGWQAREGLSPEDYGAWRDNGSDGRREFRAAPGAAPGNYRSVAPELYNGSGDKREFSAYPGIEAGNYR